jgi:hypothetical protein
MTSVSEPLTVIEPASLAVAAATSKAVSVNVSLFFMFNLSLMVFSAHRGYDHAN